MSKNKSTKIDRNRLMKCLKARGYTFSEASVQLGQARNYLTNATRDNYITLALERSIEKFFDIPIGEYATTEQGGAEDPDVFPVFVEIDYEKLQRAIYCAVLGVARKMQREGYEESA